MDANQGLLKKIPGRAVGRAGREIDAVTEAKVPPASVKNIVTIFV